MEPEEQDYFNPWRPTIDSLQLVRDFPSDETYSAQSAPLSLSGAPTLTVNLPLFGSVSVSGKGAGQAMLASQGEKENPLTSADIKDSVLHVGGPVWGLSWCPADVWLPGAGGASAAAGGAEAGPNSSGGGGGRGGVGSGGSLVQYLAVCCHPLHSPHNVIGTPTQGPCLIQLWEAPCPEQPRGGEPGLPGMAMAIAHDGGLTLQCQWCPDARLADDLAAGAAGPAGVGAPLPRLGLLAAVLGDGTVGIWAVPHPWAVRQRLGISSRAAGAAGPGPGPRPAGGALIVSLRPVAVIASQQLGGSMPAILDWLPAKPHDLMVVGCWDGNVAVVRLLPSSSRLQSLQQQQQQQQGQQHGGPGWELLSFFPAEPVPIRCLRWIPPGPCKSTVDLLHRHLFITAGHAGAINLWDDRDTFAPLYRQQVATYHILNAVWTVDPLGIMASMEDASLRGWPLDSEIARRNAALDKAAIFQTWRGKGMGAIWALDAHPSMQLVAYGGEDGDVGVFGVDYGGNVRQRMAHTPIAGLRKQDDVLVLRNASQMIMEGHGLYTRKVLDRLPNIQSARFPLEVEAVHRVAWGCPAATSAAWLASGGAAGLVRLQWVQKR